MDSAGTFPLGRLRRALGRIRARSLGQPQQLLAITHQAQVAAQAHQHILVQKHHHEQTQSELVILTGSAQVDELARMSGGVTITEVTRDHARSLLTDVK